MKRKEIGSEFHLSPTIVNTSTTEEDTIFEYLKNYNISFYDSGRSALRALLGKINVNKVLLPDYICESVRNCFPQSSITYYNINDSFLIDWDDLLEKCKDDIDILYIHYFNGYIGSEYDFEKLFTLKKEKNFLIIEDTTHSFLSNKCTIGDYCVCSLRKWFPISDGGVLYSQNCIPESTNMSSSSWYEEKRRAMIHKGCYLKGDKIKKEEFLSAFSTTETLLDAQSESFALSTQTHYDLKKINIKKIAQSRKENFLILLKNLSELPVVAFGGVQQVPLFFTISINERDQLRKYLTENDIYCPVHWPLYSELEERDGSVYKQKRELSIPIDQRYNEDDMFYIIKTIKKYISKV